MSYLTIMKVNAGTSRVEKFAEFPTQAKAEEHAQSFIKTYPQAYVAVKPEGPSSDWSCNVGAGSITIDAVVDPLLEQKVFNLKRSRAYPSIADQLDDLYHNGIDGWKTTIKVTKDKYPKG